MTDEANTPAADDDSTDARAVRALVRDARLQLEPSAAIDARIVAAAEAAAAARRRGPSAYRRHRYGGWGLAMAAGIALCVVLLRTPALLVPGSEAARSPSRSAETSSPMTPAAAAPRAAVAAEQQQGEPAADAAAPMAPQFAQPELAPAMRAETPYQLDSDLRAPAAPRISREAAQPDAVAEPDFAARAAGAQREVERQTVDVLAAPAQPLRPVLRDAGGAGLLGGAVGATAKSERRNDPAAPAASPAAASPGASAASNAATKAATNASVAPIAADASVDRAAPPAAVAPPDASELELALLRRMHATKDARLLVRLRAFAARYPDFPLRARAPELAALLAP